MGGSPVMRCKSGNTTRLEVLMPGVETKSAGLLQNRGVRGIWPVFALFNAIYYIPRPINCYCHMKNEFSQLREAMNIPVTGISADKPLRAAGPDTVRFSLHDGVPAIYSPGKIERCIFPVRLFTRRRPAGPNSRLITPFCHKYA
jgi:hypothetical protein